jgi:hypothetical protein
MKKIAFYLIVIFSCISANIYAQQTYVATDTTQQVAGDAVKADSLAKRPTVEMATVLYENGKIYLVVLVLLTIFAGIIFYMARLDRKISKLENNK